MRKKQKQARGAGGCGGGDGGPPSAAVGLAGGVAAPRPRARPSGGLRPPGLPRLRQVRASLCRLGPHSPLGCSAGAGSFSSQCECSALGTCPSQPTLFPDPNTTTALDITPRTRFQILGWYCALPGCNQSVKVLDPWPMINLPTTYPQPFGNWSGDQSQLVNGGVPQAGNLARMLQTLETGIDSWIPDRQWCVRITRSAAGPTTLLFTAVRGGQGRARRD